MITMAVNTSPSSPTSISWNRRLSFVPALASKRKKVSLDESFADNGYRVENPPLQVQDGITMPAMRRKGSHEVKMSKMDLNRPANIVVPELISGDVWKEELSARKEIEAEGNEYYFLVSRRGSRRVMEDSYDAKTNINGDAKQAFFGVYDGHGGRAAVDFVIEKLGKNVISAVTEVVQKEKEQLNLAIKAAYMNTDKEFLTQGLTGGACAATVLLKNNELHVANVGDCRVVMCKNGVADALTVDHNAGREDERTRIENSGGYASRHNGIWRVQGSLAVSRAIGDAGMKDWIISEPEMNNLPLTLYSEFLILATDGLWDKVKNQEAVDIVMRSKNYMKSCKELVELSSSRGSRDDITVMIVDLQKFL